MSNSLILPRRLCPMTTVSSLFSAPLEKWEVCSLINSSMRVVMMELKLLTITSSIFLSIWKNDIYLKVSKKFPHLWTHTSFYEIFYVLQRCRWQTFCFYSYSRCWKQRLGTELQRREKLVHRDKIYLSHCYTVFVSEPRIEGHLPGQVPPDLLICGGEVWWLIEKYIIDNRQIRADIQ